MSISRELLSQIGLMLAPLRNKIANSIARAVVQMVDDSTKLQLLQLGVLAGEDVDDAERFQNYGVFSVPLAGAEAVVIFPNGDRGHPLVVAVDDRRHRPRGGEPGEAGLYTHEGDELRLAKNRLVILKTGGRLEVRGADGTALGANDELVHGTGVDPFTGATYKVLGSTTSSVRAKK